MAGRPKTMAAKVDQIEVAAFNLAEAIAVTLPRQYRQGCRPDDRLGQMWCESLCAARELWIEISFLGDHLRERAGLEPWWPTVYGRLPPRQAQAGAADFLLGGNSAPLSLPEARPGDNPSEPTDAPPDVYVPA